MFIKCWRIFSIQWLPIVILVIFLNKCSGAIKKDLNTTSSADSKHTSLKTTGDKSVITEVVYGDSESCRAFTEGVAGRKEFNSPGWPGPYPNQTDCVMVLEAPKGYLLRLDFRDCFDIEPSDDCRFDYLEVRDGAHGYCRLLGLFCGKEFPPMITSSDRFLWLHFHSDDNIEYAGFKAVYDFIPKPTSSSISPELGPCRLEADGNEGVFGTNDITEERLEVAKLHHLAIDCMWVITVTTGWKIQLSFPEFKLEKPNDCDNNFVDVFSDRTDLPSRQRNFCGSIADSVVSRGNVLFVRFFAEVDAINSKFTALYTAFREKATGEKCSEDEWDCEDATCISILLRCNGRVNCRHRWDEDECIVSKKTAMSSEHIVIIMVVFSFILSGMCVTFFFHCLKKLVRDYRTIQEHVRQNYDHQLSIYKSPLHSKYSLSHANSNCTLSDASSLQKAEGASGCYVPTVASELILPVLQIHEKAKEFTELDIVQPEMFDTACQTRNDDKNTLKKQASERYRSEEHIDLESLSDRAVYPGKSAPDVIATVAR